SQRSKEYAHDYRYFPEPDLPPLILDPAWVESIRKHLPELPDERRDRFMAQYALSAYDASLLTASRAMADFFEETLRVSPRTGEALVARAKEVANWVIGDLAGLLNASNTEIEHARLKPAALAEMLDLMDEGTLSGRMAKEVFEEMFRTGASPRRIVRERGLAQINDQEALRAVVRQVLDSNPQAVADYRRGKQTALGFLVGQVMKATRGQANPQVANQIVAQELAAPGPGERG
ncbi:MAG: Asp-tRNA(Asn)/Glu-tRNA(Gln) amidotransferase GatCAB subunit B, partial [Chloroflexi bacterium]|nr:Asp-tRNA(Asn)/Glu-tRNA(Gln) amidotransferase GatCAB subunit B [Chloroflexota bacterium]